MFTPCNVYPACPVGSENRTGVKSERYFTGACPACPARPVECETYSSGVGQNDRTGVECKAYFTREPPPGLVSQAESEAPIF